jgi:NAD(P)H-dependent flavin oxidoreductase YrpB (nitropropane dioxygenase family)
MRTTLTDLLGCRYPIIQTGMGWISDARLTAATSAAGGFGILAASTMTPEETARSIAEIKERTDAPFGVNFLVAQPGAREIVDLIISEGVRVASFSRGPTEELFREFKEAGVLVIPSIGAPRHAVKVAAWGADAVIAQGTEAGGHTGAIASSLLIPGVIDAVDLPVVAAGGFYDGRGLAAALAWGAAGIAMGTRFLLVTESPAPDRVKQFYFDSAITATTVTTAVDGLPNRVLVNKMVQQLETGGRLRRTLSAIRGALKLRKSLGVPMIEYLRSGLALKRNEKLSWSQALLTAHAAEVYKAGVLDGDLEGGVFSGGQVTGLIDDLPSCAELIERIVDEARTTLAGLHRYEDAAGGGPGTGADGA